MSQKKFSRGCRTPRSFVRGGVHQKSWKKNSCEANIYLLRIYLSSIDHFVHFNDEILIESLKETRGGGGESKNDATTIDADDRSKGGRGRGGEEGGKRGGRGRGREGIRPTRFS